MSRFPSPATADRKDARIQELNDGFERLGDQDTPFTLRGGGSKRDRAQAVHDDREDSARARDEESNEPVTRDIAQWQDDMVQFDFPFVDTIPVLEYRRRADQVAEVALDEDVIDRIDRDVEFADQTVRGKFWRGVKLIEVGADTADFPGFREGVVLAHELGHAFYDAWTPESGIEDAPYTRIRRGRRVCCGGCSRCRNRSWLHDSKQPAGVCRHLR